MIIEIATADYTTTASAVQGGADRIELCAALSEGGITPSHGMIRKCRESFSLELFPIIRPRGGDFLYTEEEFRIMKQDVLFCRETGCEGVVIGLLQKDGRLDMDRMSRLIDLAFPMEVTCHRAFDRCRDPFEALELLIEAGCTRILTSGQKKTAPEGMQLIAELVKKAEDRIIIMPGSGVRADNIAELARVTGAVEFHSSLRGQKPSEMEFIHPAFTDSFETNVNPSIDPPSVRRLREALSEVQ
jgi:copper homeostasis protein